MLAHLARARRAAAPLAAHSAACAQRWPSYPSARPAATTPSDSTPVISTDLNAAPGVALLTICRPAALNALNSDVMRELTAAAHAADARPDVRAIVLTGQGIKAFAAGADIKELRAETYESVRRVGGALGGRGRRGSGGAC